MWILNASVDSGSEIWIEVATKQGDGWNDTLSEIGVCFEPFDDISYLTEEEGFVAYSIYKASHYHSSVTQMITTHRKYKLPKSCKHHKDKRTDP